MIPISCFTNDSYGFLLQDEQQLEIHTMKKKVYCGHTNQNFRSFIEEMGAVFFGEKTQKERALLYLQLLQKGALKCQVNIRCVQDRVCSRDANAKTRSAHITKAWLKKMRVRVQEWIIHLQSGFSPMQNLQMEKKSNPVQDKITAETLHHLVFSMP